MPTPHIHWTNVAAKALAANTEWRSHWDRLNASRADLPILTSSLVGSAVTILGKGTERLLVGTIESRIVAMLILEPAGVFQWRTFQPSQLPLGTWVADHSLPLEQLTRSLVRGPLGPCMTLSVTQVDPMMAPRADEAPDVGLMDYIETGWIDVDGSFDAYWSARGKNLRQNMRKQRSRLQADGVKLSMQVLRDKADMAPAITAYGQLESAGWKASQGTAIHPDNIQGRFYRQLLEQASEKCEAVVYQYLFDERIVAMNVCLQRSGVLIVLKTTYDESIKSFSPAFLLREAELQDIFATGAIRRIEYFGRIMDWHTKLTDRKRTLYHLTCYRWPLLKVLASARRRKPTSDAKQSEHSAKVTPPSQDTASPVNP